MSTNPFENAALPEAQAVVSALITFIGNLGSDPTKIPMTAGPAAQVFFGTIGLQVPALFASEWGAVQSAGVAQLQAVNAKLAALGTPAAPAA